MLELLVSQFHASSILELTAVIFAIAYLLLAIRENILCWYAAFISTSIFLLIFWQVNLYMESGLQVYYLAMAVYGWYQWTRGGNKQSGISISTWSIASHLLSLAVILIATIASGYLLSENSCLLYTSPSPRDRG